MDDDEGKSLPQSRAEDAAAAHPPSSAAASSSPPTELSPAASSAPPATSSTDEPPSNSANDDDDNGDDKKPSSKRKSSENATRSREATSSASKKRKADDVDVDLERKAETSAAQATTARTREKNESPAENVDVATQLGLRIGDRLQVYWTICDEASDDDHDDEKGAVNDGQTNEDGDRRDEAKKEVATMWWAASLAKHTGRTHMLTDEELEEGDADAEPSSSRNDTRTRGRTPRPDDAPVRVPVYELNYDPMPDYGYPDHSVEEVCFVSDHVLLNLSTQEMMTFKREGAPSPPTSPRRDDLSVRFPHLDERLLADGNEPGTDRIVEEFTDEDQLRSYMNGIMEETFKRSGMDVKMKKLSAAKQRLVAERIGKAKEELLEKLMREVEGMERGKKVLTGDLVRKCVGEMKL